MGVNRFVTESSLREQLADARKRLADVEADLVTKQAGALELQFENTRLSQDVDRLKRRLSELAAVRDLLRQATGTGVGVGGPSGDGHSRLRRPSISSAHGRRGAGAGGSGAGSSSSSRRVRELEAVVQELTKEATKRRQEAERLRKLLGGRKAGKAGDQGLKAAQEEAASARAALKTVCACVLVCLCACVLVRLVLCACRVVLIG